MPEIRVSEDERQAAIVLATGERLGSSQALIFLARQGVRYGHLPKALATLPDLVGPAELVVAEAEAACPPRDARIEMVVGDLDFTYGAVLDVDGEPTFPPPPLPCLVAPDEVVAVKVPAVPGRAGRGVTGKALGDAPGAVEPALGPADAELRIGPGCEPTPDGRRAAATVAGNPACEDGVVVVRPERRINGDLTFAVGDVTFDGNVLVMGDVEPGRAIEATGNVTVLGVVVGAAITAGRRIVVHGGVRQDAALRAGTDVIAQFVEGSRVWAGRSVYVREDLAHARVEAARDVVCGGALVGGCVRATEHVEAAELGTHLGTPTRVEVVPPPPPPDPRPALMKERQGLAATLSQVRLRVEEAQRVVARQGPDRQKGQEAAGMLEKLSELLRGLVAQDEALEARIAAAGSPVQAAPRPTATIRKAIHVGAHVLLGQAALRVDAEYPGGKLQEAGGCVRMSPLAAKGNGR